MFDNVKHIWCGLFSEVSQVIAGNDVDVNGKVVNVINTLITHQQDACYCSKWFGKKEKQFCS